MPRSVARNAAVPIRDPRLPRFRSDLASIPAHGPKSVACAYGNFTKIPYGTITFWLGAAGGSQVRRKVCWVEHIGCTKSCTSAGGPVIAAGSTTTAIGHRASPASGTAMAVSSARIPPPAMIDAEPATRASGERPATTATTRLALRSHELRVIHSCRGATPSASAYREGIELATRAACRDDGNRGIASTFVLTPRAQEVGLHLGALDRDPRPRRGYWTHRRANLGARVGASSFFAERPDGNDPGRTGAQIWGRALVRPLCR